MPLSITLADGTGCSVGNRRLDYARSELRLDGKPLCNTHRGVTFRMDAGTGIATVVIRESHPSRICITIAAPREVAVLRDTARVL